MANSCLQKDWEKRWKIMRCSVYIIYEYCFSQCQLPAFTSIRWDPRSESVDFIETDREGQEETFRLLYKQVKGKVKRVWIQDKMWLRKVVKKQMGH